MFGAFSTKTDNRLALSDDATIECILSDIPLFCVGLLAFGVATFFLVMKRVNLLSIYLCTSALLSFGAAILDLSQLLARGRTNVDNGIDDDGLTGLIITREVGLALSLGFRFLFFWTFVAERPRGEAQSWSDNGPFNPREHAHSASWRRWGLVGFFLQWGLLALTLSIPINQVIWRIAQRKYGVVYQVGSTIEIVVIAMFILKIALNTFLSPNVWWQAAHAYVAPLVALLLNLGIGVGDLLLFAFSETTLGRFLQAVELYTLILYVLISAFRGAPSPSANPRPRRSRGTSSFLGLREKADESVAQAPVSPRDTAVMGRAFSSADEARRPVSTLSRIGSWMIGRNLPSAVSTRSSFQTADPEKGVSTQTLPMQREMNVGRFSAVQTTIKAGVSLLRKADIPNLSKAEISAPSDQGIAHSAMPSVRSGIEHPVAIRDPERAASSPVYGLHGIIADADTYNDPESRSHSLSSFDELLRQQTELDKSIAALKLFSSDSSVPSAETETQSTSTQVKPVSSNRLPSTASGSYSGQRLDSVSVRSEFSLSIFPEPPITTDDGIDITQSRQSYSSHPVGRNVGLPSIPSSPNHLDTSRLNSAGTQYEITSFIGDLTVPSNMQSQGPGSSFINNLSDVESEGVHVSASGNQNLRPMLLTSAIPSSVQRTSPPPHNEIGLPSSNQPILRPFILGSGPGSTAPLRPSGVVPVGARFRTGGSSGSRHGRFNISGPRPQTSDSDQPGLFERPRPPPSLTVET